MTLQGKRKASRCYWIVWLSTVILLTLLTLVKMTTSSFGAGFENDEVKRQLRTADTGTAATQEENGFEDRDAPLSDNLMQAFAPSVIESLTQKTQQYASILGHQVSPTIADDLFQKHKVSYIKDDNLISSGQFQSWVYAVMAHYKGDDRTAVDKIIATLTNRFGETKLRKILHNQESGVRETDAKFWANAQLMYWGKNRASDDDIILKMLKLDDAGQNILTDSSLLHTWVNFVGQKNGVKDPYALLFKLLKKQLNEKQLAEYLAVASVNHDNINLQIHASTARRSIVAGWNHDRMTLNDVYTLLRLNEKPGPLKTPALRMWEEYAKLKQVKHPETWLFARLPDFYKDEAVLARAVIAAKTTQTKPLADKLQAELFKKWRMNAESSNDVDGLLKSDGIKDLKIQQALSVAAKLYRFKYNPARWQKVLNKPRKPLE